MSTIFVAALIGAFIGFILHTLTPNGDNVIYTATLLEDTAAGAVWGAVVGCVIVFITAL